MDMDIRVERAKALYEEDTVMEYRKSHDNVMVKKLYDEFLGKPNSHKAHDLLHTHYVAREQFPSASNENEGYKQAAAGKDSHS